MSVELLDSPRFHGFRVRRQIKGKTYQEYYSLKEHGKRIRGARRKAIKEQVEARDAELAAEQAAARAKAALDIAVNRKGEVRGILFRLKSEKNGKKTPVFQLGIMSHAENRIVNTTVSVPAHGLEAGWKKAVDFYAKHKRISKRSGAYRQLLDAQPSERELKRLQRLAK